MRGGQPPRDQPDSFADIQQPLRRAIGEDQSGIAVDDQHGLGDDAERFLERLARALGPAIALCMR